MKFEKWTKEIHQHLTECMNKYTTEHYFKEVMSYSVLPPGKVFRPLLVYSLAHDLEQLSESHKVLASALEIHHTYTLIHDDLPAMDNDDYRRGRPSSHKKFNEWNAILAGDALLNLSYELLAEVNPKHISSVLKIFGEKLGSKGLILGQVLDLANKHETLKDILKIHELKTSRLIQVALEACAILSEREDIIDDCSCLGFYLGINFQLLDDLGELTEEISGHEKDINPFFKFDPENILNIIKNNNTEIFKILNKHKLENLRSYIEVFLDKSHQKVLEGAEMISRNSNLESNFINKCFDYNQ